MRKKRTKNEEKYVKEIADIHLNRKDKLHSIYEMTKNNRHNCTTPERILFIFLFFFLYFYLHIFENEMHSLAYLYGFFSLLHCGNSFFVNRKSERREDFSYAIGMQFVCDVLHSGFGFSVACNQLLKLNFMSDIEIMRKDEVIAYFRFFIVFIYWLLLLSSVCYLRIKTIVVPVANFQIK